MNLSLKHVNMKWRRLSVKCFSPVSLDWLRSRLVMHSETLRLYLYSVTFWLDVNQTSKGRDPSDHVLCLALRGWYFTVSWEFTYLTPNKSLTDLLTRKQSLQLIWLSHSPEYESLNLKYRVIVEFMLFILSPQSYIWDIFFLKSNNPLLFWRTALERLQFFDWT